MTRLFLPLFALGMTSMLLLFTGCSDGVEVLECEGSCSCDQETRTCACHGGTDCTIDGANDIIFECDGNADCDLHCGSHCHVICPGTTTCTASLGDQGSAECRGTATCNYECRGDCEINCGSNANCTVECADGCEQQGNTCVC